MLLDLVVQEGRARDVFVSDLATVGATSLTTGLRYIQRLATAGLIRRQDHHTDGRKTIVMLTDDGRALIAAALLQTSRPIKIIRPVEPDRNVFAAIRQLEALIDARLPKRRSVLQRLGFAR